MEEMIVQGMWYNQPEEIVFLWSDGYAYFWKRRYSEDWVHYPWYANGEVKAGSKRDTRTLHECKKVLDMELVAW